MRRAGQAGLQVRPPLARPRPEAEWVSRIGAVIGWNGTIVPVPGERLPVLFNTAQYLCVATARIRAELGYRAVVDPDNALRASVAWERDNLPEPTVDYAEEDLYWPSSAPGRCDNRDRFLRRG